MQPAVFLDRDGVLNEDLGYVYRIEDLRVLPGVPEALAALKAKGFLLVVVSNQSGVARGLFGTEAVDAFHEALRAELRRRAGVELDAVLYCPHHPAGAEGPYRRECDCRKPGTGMLLEAEKRLGIDLARSWMVGDKPSDVGCALAAGVGAIQVMSTGEALDPDAEAHVADLPAAAAYILAR
jgi:D-glycero-D-manno-heptose 1,7-bisphosphate phosphatase